MAKLWQTEMLGEVVDECLQFFGGYGYMLEYPISARLHGRARAAHLRGHQRNHEGHHRQADGAVGLVAVRDRSASPHRAESSTCDGGDP